MVVRGDSLERSMSSYLIEQIAGVDNIEVRLNSSVLKCEGTDRLQCVTFVDHDGGQQVVDAGHLFVFIGAAPLTDWLPEAMVRDKAGFVVTGPELMAGTGERPPSWDLERDPYLLESSIPGVFVAGDVRAASVKRVDPLASITIPTVVCIQDESNTLGSLPVSYQGATVAFQSVSAS